MLPDAMGLFSKEHHHCSPNGLKIAKTNGNVLEKFCEEHGSLILPIK
jgi:hypothetical protein